MMEISLTSRVRATIEEHKLIPQEGQSILVALSGGADSVALLHILHELGYKVAAAHCNFHLRGDESDEDTAFVEDLCNNWGIQLYSIDFDTIRYAREQSISIEMAARDLRYGWFAQLQKELGIDLIAVAHHADDNAETMIMNLCRGTGISGLCGMPYKREGGIIRPLLDTTRKEIEYYLQEHGIAFRTDSSNQDTRFRRNLIRHKIMPLLKELNPSIEEALMRTRENLEGVQAFYTKAIEEIQMNLRETGRIDIQRAKNSPAPFTLLYEILAPYGFNRDQIRDITASLYKEPGATFYAPSYRLLRERKELSLLPYSGDKESSMVLRPDIPAKEALSLPNGYKLSWKIGSPKELGLENLHLPPNQLILPISFIYSEEDGTRGKSLSVRHIQPGDTIYPYGMRGKKKVSRFFIDRHTPRSEREEAWLLCQGEQIIWIMGHAADRRFALSSLSDDMDVILFLFEKDIS